jgi:hypothetical protein
MKKIIYLALMVVSLTTLFSGCKKEPIVPVKTTGNLIVLPKLSGSSILLPGTEVGIATSLENFDNDIYLSKKYATSDGKAYFGELNPGNYYVYGYYDDGTNVLYGQGQFQVTANTDLNLTVYLD